MNPSETWPPRTLFCMLLMALCCAASVAKASRGDCVAPIEPCAEPSLSILAILDIEAAEVRATTVIRWTHCGAEDLEAVSVLMPAAVHVDPRADLDDRNFAWRYPRGIGTARCEILRSEVTEGPPLAGELPKVCSPVTAFPLTESVGTGESITLELETRVSLPARFGTFGAARGMLTLRGGWHPTLPVLEVDGFRPGAGAGPYRASVEVTPTRRTPILIGTSLAEAAPDDPAMWAGEVREPIALVAAPDLRLTRLEVGPRSIDLIHRSPPPAKRDLYAPGDLLQTDWFHEREAGLRRVLEDFRDPFDGRKWTLVVVPMYEPLVVPGVDLVFVAESLYEVTSLDILTRYHDATLTGALLSTSVRRAMPKTHPWLAMVAGTVLGRRMRSERDLDAIRDLARRGEFIHAIDQFGTDAQIPQEDLFFQRARGGNPYAREAEFAATTALPSPWTAARVVDEIAAVRAIEDGGRVTIDAPSVAALTGSRWAPAFCAWIEGGHQQELDLSVRLESGGEGHDGSNNLIVAQRAGAGGGLPVRIRIEHRDGGVRYIPWDTAHETARWSIPGVVQRVVVDPDRRIPQRRNRPTLDLRYDDSNRRDLKWIFARPWVSFESGEPIPTAYVELDLQRRHDLRSTWVLQPRLFPSRAELLVGHRWGFGRLARPNMNRWQLTVGLKGAAGFEGTGSFSPGIKTLLYFDNRRALFNPFRGGWAYLYAEIFPGDTQEGWRASSKIGLGGAKLFGLRPDLVFVLRGQADTRVGDTPSWEVLQAGGTLGVRGLTVAGFSPRHRLAASVELRWMLARNVRASLAKSIFLRGIQVVFFSDAALLGSDYDSWFEERFLYQSAGLGIRVHADLFGVFPAVFAIDQAFVLPIHGKQFAPGTMAYFSQSF